MSEDGEDLAAAGLTKASLRSWARSRRDGMSPNELADAARHLTDVVLDAPELASARCVAVYASVGREPGTRHLLDALVSRETLVLLPVVLADLDLDWAEYTGLGDLEPAAHGLVEPVGVRLGTKAITHADVVLTPAMAVDRVGHRLGRGGGSYDRALTRVAPDAFRCALVYDGELLPYGVHIPAEPHDMLVNAAATPSALVRFAAT